jgi:hypothetical protein
MFALPPGTAAKLVHVNIRGEFHGVDVVPQADIRLEVALPNAILDAFDPALRTCLYMRAPPAHPQAMLPDLPGVEPVSDTPALRFPELAMPLKWGAEGTGYTTTIETASGLLPALTLQGVTVKIGSPRLHGRGHGRGGLPAANHRQPGRGSYCRASAVRPAGRADVAVPAHPGARLGDVPRNGPCGNTLLSRKRGRAGVFPCHVWQVAIRPRYVLTLQPDGV